MLGLNCEFQPPRVFFIFSPEIAENPIEKFTANPTGALARIAKNSTSKNPKFPSLHRISSPLNFWRFGEQII